MHVEHFEPVGSEDGRQGAAGGTITFHKSDVEADSDGTRAIREVGEDAGLDLPFGCRIELAL